MRKNSKIAVIGGGPMGMAVAYELTLKGYKPVIFEADNRLGGMASCFDFEGLEIERYYHFHCLNDKGFFRIIDEIGLKDQLNWKKTKMGFYYQGRLYKWGSLLSVIMFSKVSFFTRLRYLFHAARCLTIKDWNHLDNVEAVNWLRKWLGEEGYEKLWKKLFDYKFYQFSNHISAAWIWSRINRLGKSRKKLKENLGFLQNGSIQLINEMSKIIKEKGGEIKISSPIINIKPLKKSGAFIKTPTDEYRFDLVISTIPLPLVGEIFSKSNINNLITNSYKKLNYVACACVILKTKKKVTNNFWTNINDSRFSIPGIIEMSNLRNLPENITYIPFYMPQNHPDYLRDDESFKEDAWKCIKAINPNLKNKDLISSHCSRYKYAQPICEKNFKDKLPDQEPFNGIFTVDTTVYYPEDRGISESIDFGRNLVKKIIKIK